ncbi:MAG TPA: di-trans,poly-cis-decaprenylcistransferase [Candidatus Sulfopaludibacter sp.]|nr:di-trans,poly-cis-decaprenylcistransferase [Candidatus Sulfopaludibacter sp.]
MPIYFEFQSTLHIGIIMDVNGRWAAARGLPRVAGHRAGVQAVRKVIEAAPPAGVRTLTLFAFSSDNWRRPPDEVGALMQLLGVYLDAETRRCVTEGIRLEVIGRRDRLEPSLREAIAAAESATAAGGRLRLRIAIDYSGRDAILAAARGTGELSRESFDRTLGPPVDLLIRTGGEQRLSDFLLWECAYAELVFSRRMWPDFDGDDLRAAVREFRGRQRRFGAVPEAPPMRQEAWLD